MQADATQTQDFSPKRARAFAPATVANVAVGFDVLGFSFDAAGDTVTATRRKASTLSVTIKAINGITGLPLEADKNTASVATLALLNAQKCHDAFDLVIDKGLAIGSGMGGSAASAVAAVVAVNALLDTPLPQEELLNYAVDGEAIAAGSRHADNVAPCLFGGLSLCLPEGGDLPGFKYFALPHPALFCALVKPDIMIHTKDARQILRKEIPLRTHIDQSARLAGFISACYENDLTHMGRFLQDDVIEPQRKQLIHGFDAAKQAALDAGAVGCSISGAGPATFALCTSLEKAKKTARAMVDAYAAAGVASQSWHAPLQEGGAKIIAPD